MSQGPRIPASRTNRDGLLFNMSRLEGAHVGKKYDVGGPGVFFSNLRKAAARVRETRLAKDAWRPASRMA